MLRSTGQGSGLEQAPVFQHAVGHRASCLPGGFEVGRASCRGRV